MGAGRPLNLPLNRDAGKSRRPAHPEEAMEFEPTKRNPIRGIADSLRLQAVAADQQADALRDSAKSLREQADSWEALAKREEAGK